MTFLSLTNWFCYVDSSGPFNFYFYFLVFSLQDKVKDRVVNPLIWVGFCWKLHLWGSLV
jgi:hypothetical protein